MRLGPQDEPGASARSTSRLCHIRQGNAVCKKEHCGDGRRPAEKVGGSSCAEYRPRGTRPESGSRIRTFAMLQEDDDEQQDRQHKLKSSQQYQQHREP